MTICCQQIKWNACLACWFSFHCCSQTNWYPWHSDISFICFFVLIFSLYSKTNTTTSQPQPSQVRSELLCYCSCKSWRGVAIHQDASIALYSQYSIYAICIDAIYLCIDASIALYSKFPDLVVELPLWIIQASWRSLWINK